MQQFVGDIWQKPPAYSALRVDGKRAYELARLVTQKSDRCLGLLADRTSTRSGQDVDLPPRQVTLHSISLVDFTPPNFSILVRCGGGLYVRSLVQVCAPIMPTPPAPLKRPQDIALKLDSCAHTISLERTQQGPFTTRNALREEEWTPERVLLAVDQWRSATSKVASC